MAAADLHEPGAADVVRQALDERIVLNSTGPVTVRFVPPLVIEEADVDRVLDFLEGAL